MGKKLLEVRDLKTHLFTRRGVIKAVDGVSFSVDKNETLGLVGESGCGKTITCLSILKLLPNPVGQIVGGKIIFDNVDLLSKSEKEMRKIRGRRISMILQDPMTSLDPLFTIGEQIAEPIRSHQNLERTNLRKKIIEMLKLVKISAPEARIKEYPFQMSGGMRQRIVGAIALSCQPDLLIADEPTTALDVTIQAQFMRLLKEIQQEFNMAMIMITHDFGIVAKVCDRVAVMYSGKIVESAGVRDLFNHPLHPYTKALMGALPKMEEDMEKLTTIDGQPPDLGHLPPGCNFAARCPEVKEICRCDSPILSEINDGHVVSCLRVQ
ncbi:MAG: dipeptide/oligopeptide/nickel ABC transporter ATP-binding protein [Deltaproteobacteria bacterium RBG_13_43_22]|jgi:oligopeptide/dipeptide ABC transporter ATP-binding protein|nr:MAG: dipeptide/oligopeptide/nickel ABC transporter ATP-binding protein [Deltaproteobacteria bacterium RBG_13_43_22]